MVASERCSAFPRCSGGRPRRRCRSSSTCSRDSVPPRLVGRDGVPEARVPEDEAAASGSRTCSSAPEGRRARAARARARRPAAQVFAARRRLRLAARGRHRLRQLVQHGLPRGIGRDAVPPRPRSGAEARPHAPQRARRHRDPRDGGQAGLAQALAGGGPRPRRGRDRADRARRHADRPRRRAAHRGLRPRGLPRGSEVFLFTDLQRVAILPAGRRRARRGGSDPSTRPTDAPSPRS